MQPLPTCLVFDPSAPRVDSISELSAWDRAGSPLPLSRVLEIRRAVAVSPRQMNALCDLRSLPEALAAMVSVAYGAQALVRPDMWRTEVGFNVDTPAARHEAHHIADDYGPRDSQAYLSGRLGVLSCTDSEATEWLLLEDTARTSRAIRILWDLTGNRWGRRRIRAARAKLIWNACLSANVTDETMATILTDSSSPQAWRALAIEASWDTLIADGVDPMAARTMLALALPAKLLARMTYDPQTGRPRYAYPGR